MLTQLNIAFHSKHNDEVNIHFGSLLHGYLMENVNCEIADILHKNEMKPLSQSVFFDGKENKWIWRINGLNQLVKEKILEPMQKKDRIILKHKNKSFDICPGDIKTVTYKEFVEQFYTVSPNRRISLSCKTPVAFKSDGQYICVPKIHLIYYNLVNRWNMYSNTFKLDDNEAIAHMIEHTNISNYNLKTVNFHLESSKVKGFMGMMSLYIRGPEALVSLSNLILSFSQYAGLGIKTTLGMGGINLE